MDHVSSLEMAARIRLAHRLAAELTHRLMMAGLNHESTDERRAADFCIDLEITSNRPDCLGHIGISARSLGAFAAATEGSTSGTEVGWRVDREISADSDRTPGTLSAVFKPGCCAA